LGRAEIVRIKGKGEEKGDIIAHGIVSASPGNMSDIPNAATAAATTCRHHTIIFVYTIG